jgi:hypothetical protein
MHTGAMIVVSSMKALSVCTTQPMCTQRPSVVGFIAVDIVVVVVVTSMQIEEVQIQPNM